MASKSSLKKLLKEADGTKTILRPLAGELLSNAESLTTERLADIVVRVEWEMKGAFWKVFKSRSDRTVQQLRSIELVLKRDLRNFKHVVAEIEDAVDEMMGRKKEGKAA